MNKADDMETLKVFSPYDGEQIGKLNPVGEPEMEAMLATAHRLFSDRSSWLPKSQRINILRKTAEIIRERRTSLAVAAAQEGGKPLVDSLVEIDRAADGIECCVEEIRGSAGNVIPMQIDSNSSSKVAFTQYEPIGVVAAVSAFNHPFNLIVHQVAPAVATGCPVLVKSLPLQRRLVAKLL